MKRIKEFLISLIIIVCVYSSGFADTEIQRMMPLVNYNIELSVVTKVLSDNKASMSLFSTIVDEDALRMWNDLLYLRLKTKIRDIDFYINSIGGGALTGLAIADMINYAQNSWGFNFVAHSFGIIASAAVPIFAVCNQRFSAKSTIFMVHKAYMSSGALGTLTSRELESQKTVIDMIEKRYTEILVNETNLKTETWKEMQEETTWFDINKAKEIGLVQREEGE